MPETASPLSQQTLTVSQLTRYLKYLLEQDEFMAALSVRGEICEYSRAASGHIYFAIKDAGSQIPCVLFRREAAQQPDEVAELRKGVAVVVHGFLTVYEARGTCQIYVERVIPEGEGSFARNFERLKTKLESEGLFAAERKRPLPRYPKSVALVTSPGSQAYHDVLHRLRTQFPFVRVIEVGVTVQGDAAPDEMVMALDLVNRLTTADVILLVRGGGSPEDLAAFNAERLARAIFASRIPVITGVGHELDVTIVDYVADLRAATPSLAAASAVPDLGALVQRIVRLHGEAEASMWQKLRHERSRWLQANRALLGASPQNRVRAQQQRVDDLQRSHERAMAGVMRAKRVRLGALRSQLNALDPLAILARGYTVLTDGETGAVVSSHTQAPPGRTLRAQVSDGSFAVRVEGD